MDRQQCGQSPNWPPSRDPRLLGAQNSIQWAYNNDLSINAIKKTPPTLRFPTFFDQKFGNLTMFLVFIHRVTNVIRTFCKEVVWMFLPLDKGPPNILYHSYTISRVKQNRRSERSKILGAVARGFAVQTLSLSNHGDIRMVETLKT